MSPTLIAPSAIRRARTMRRDMTDGERRLWSELKDFRRAYGLHARRQVPLGPYIADFAFHAARLVIEVDGHFHYEEDRQARDRRRDEWLNAKGYRVLRLTTGDLDTAFNGCIEEILRALDLIPTTPPADPHP